jgi:vacuolar-type H+-ATPase subunit E/Vma4
MTARPDSLLEALEPVRAALRERARSDAAHILAEAEHDSAELLGRARAEADALLDAARVRGEQEATAALAAERARSRRTVRAAQLRAHREAYDELRDRVAARLRERCAGPDGAVLTERMAGQVRAVLGAEAVITPAPGGGVRGRLAGRFADCSVDTLAERALDALGPEVEALWRE